VGSGNTAKVITNLLAMANTIVAAEGMVLGRKAGLDLESLWNVINAIVGRSFASDFYFANGILDGSFPVRFRLDLMAKDIGIVTRLGRELGVPLKLSSIVDQYLADARGQGLGAASNSAVVKLIEQKSGVDLRVSGFQAGKQTTPSPDACGGKP
jgi:3-hydroxyisobutyrate dehydrogenase